MKTYLEKLAYILQYGKLEYIPKEEMIKEIPDSHCPLDHEYYKYTLNPEHFEKFGFIEITRHCSPDNLYHFIALIFNFLKP